MEKETTPQATASTLVKHVHPYLSNDKILGMMTADLADMYEVSQWFVRTLDEARARTYTQDELHSLLVEIDIQMLTHLTWHLRSLKKYLTKVINVVSGPDENEN